VERLESSALGVREVERDREGRERLERASDPLEPLLERLRDRTHGGGVAPHGAQRRNRVAEERRALALARDPVGRDEVDRVARLEVVPFDRGDHGFLLPRLERAEREGDRRPDLSVGEPRLDPGREVRRENRSPRDPPRPATEQSRDGLLREAVLLDQRLDDPRLVERRDRPRRRVRREEEALPVHGARGSLDDHGDAREARGTRAREALEAVEQLVRALSDRRDSRRERREVVPDRAPRARPERLEARPDPVDRDEANVRLLVVGRGEGVVG
jgi:hypothetical protein